MRGLMRRRVPPLQVFQKQRISSTTDLRGYSLEVNGENPEMGQRRGTVINKGGIASLNLLEGEKAAEEVGDNPKRKIFYRGGGTQTNRTLMKNNCLSSEERGRERHG